MPAVVGLLAVHVRCGTRLEACASDARVDHRKKDRERYDVRKAWEDGTFVLEYIGERWRLGANGERPGVDLGCRGDEVPMGGAVGQDDSSDTSYQSFIHSFSC